MSVYMIVEPKEVSDLEKYQEYKNKVPKTIENFGGRYLSSGEVTLIMGDWKPERIVLIEFESKDKFLSWWNSSEYQEIAVLREQSAKVNAIVVQGL